MGWFDSLEDVKKRFPSLSEGQKRFNSSEAKKMVGEEFALVIDWLGEMQSIRKDTSHAQMRFRGKVARNLPQAQMWTRLRNKYGFDAVIAKSDMFGEVGWQMGVSPRTDKLQINEVVGRYTGETPLQDMGLGADAVKTEINTLSGLTKKMAKGYWLDRKSIEEVAKENKVSVDKATKALNQVFDKKFKDKVREGGALERSSRRPGKIPDIKRLRPVGEREKVYRQASGKGPSEKAKAEAQKAGRPVGEGVPKSTYVDRYDERRDGPSKDARVRRQLLEIKGAEEARIKKMDELVAAHSKANTEEGKEKIYNKMVELAGGIDALQEDQRKRRVLKDRPVPRDTLVEQVSEGSKSALTNFVRKTLDRVYDHPFVDVAKGLLSDVHDNLISTRTRRRVNIKSTENLRKAKKAEGDEIASGNHTETSPELLIERFSDAIAGKISDVQDALTDAHAQQTANPSDTQIEAEIDDLNGVMADLMFDPMTRIGVFLEHAGPLPQDPFMPEKDIRNTEVLNKRNFDGSVERAEAVEALLMIADQMYEEETNTGIPLTYDELGSLFGLDDNGMPRVTDRRSLVDLALALSLMDELLVKRRRKPDSNELETSGVDFYIKWYNEKLRQRFGKVGPGSSEAVHYEDVTQRYHTDRKFKRMVDREIKAAAKEGRPAKYAFAEMLEATDKVDTQGETVFKSKRLQSPVTTKKGRQTVREGKDMVIAFPVRMQPKLDEEGNVVQTEKGMTVMEEVPKFSSLTLGELVGIAVAQKNFQMEWSKSAGAQEKADKVMYISATNREQMFLLNRKGHMVGAKTPWRTVDSSKELAREGNLKELNIRKLLEEALLGEKYNSEGVPLEEDTSTSKKGKETVTYPSGRTRKKSVTIHDYSSKPKTFYTDTDPLALAAAYISIHQQENGSWVNYSSLKSAIGQDDSAITLAKVLWEIEKGNVPGFAANRADEVNLPWYANSEIQHSRESKRNKHLGPEDQIRLAYSADAPGSWTTVEDTVYMSTVRAGKQDDEEITAAQSKAVSAKRDPSKYPEPQIKTVRGVKGSKLKGVVEAEKAGEGVSVHRKYSTGKASKLPFAHEHYGNPFATKGGPGISQVVSTNQEAAQAYFDWLQGAAEWADVNPKQRDWILGQIGNSHKPNTKLHKGVLLFHRVVPKTKGKRYLWQTHVEVLQYLLNRRRQEYLTGVKEEEGAPKVSSTKSSLRSGMKRRKLPITAKKGKLVIHSGGASGIDTIAQNGAISAGHSVLAHTFEGHHDSRKNKSRHDWLFRELLEADEHIKKANAENKLDRKFPTGKPFVDNLLRRNWFIAKGRDQVIAFAYLDHDVSYEDGSTKAIMGGSAWVPQMFVDNGGTDLHVFDMGRDEWFSWDGKRFFPSKKAPVLKDNVAIVGKRASKARPSRFDPGDITDSARYELAGLLDVNMEQVTSDVDLESKPVAKKVKTDTKNLTDEEKKVVKLITDPKKIKEAQTGTPKKDRVKIDPDNIEVTLHPWPGTKTVKGAPKKAVKELKQSADLGKVLSIAIRSNDTNKIPVKYEKRRGDDPAKAFVANGVIILAVEAEITKQSEGRIPDVAGPLKKATKGSYLEKDFRLDDLYPLARGAVETTKRNLKQSMKLKLLLGPNKATVDSTHLLSLLESLAKLGVEKINIGIGESNTQAVKFNGKTGGKTFYGVLVPELPGKERPGVTAPISLGAEAPVENPGVIASMLLNGSARDLEEVTKNMNVPEISKSPVNNMQAAIHKQIPKATIATDPDSPKKISETYITGEEGETPTRKTKEQIEAERSDEIPEGDLRLNLSPTKIKGEEVAERKKHGFVEDPDMEPLMVWAGEDPAPGKDTIEELQKRQDEANKESKGFYGEYGYGSAKRKARKITPDSHAPGIKYLWAGTGRAYKDSSKSILERAKENKEIAKERRAMEKKLRENAKNAKGEDRTIFNKRMLVERRMAERHDSMAEQDIEYAAEVAKGEKAGIRKSLKPVGIAELSRDQREEIMGFLETNVYDVYAKMAGKTPWVKISPEESKERVGEGDLTRPTILDVGFFVVTERGDMFYLQAQTSAKGKWTIGAPFAGLLSGYDKDGNLAPGGLVYAEVMPDGSINVMPNTILDDMIQDLVDKVVKEYHPSVITEMSKHMRGTFKDSRGKQDKGFNKYLKDIGYDFKALTKMKKDGNFAVHYYQHLLNYQAQWILDAENDSNPRRSPSGMQIKTNKTTGKKRRVWNKAGWPVFGEPSATGRDLRGKRISEWAMREKTRILTRLLIRMDIINSDNMDAWGSGIVTEEREPQPWSSELESVEQRKEMEKEHREDTAEGVDPESVDPEIQLGFSSEAGRDEVKGSIKSRIIKDAEEGADETPLLDLFEQDFKEGKGLGEDPYSAWSQYSYLTTDAHVSQWDAWVAARSSDWMEWDKKYAEGTGRGQGLIGALPLGSAAPGKGQTFSDAVLTPLRLNYTTQFLPGRALKERIMKQLFDKGVGEGHPIAQALDVYARQMTYFGKGSRALGIASARYYDFIAKELKKYGIKMEDFGKYVQWQAVPLRNRVQLASLKRQQKELEKLVKSIEDEKEGKLHAKVKTGIRRGKKVALNEEEYNAELEVIDRRIESLEKKDTASPGRDKALEEAYRKRKAVIDAHNKHKSLTKSLESYKKQLESVDPTRYEKEVTLEDGSVVRKNAVSGWTDEEAAKGLQNLMSRKSFQDMVKDGKVMKRYYEMNMDTLFAAYNSGQTTMEATVRMSIANTRAGDMEGKLMPLVDGGILMRTEDTTAALNASVETWHDRFFDRGDTKLTKEELDAGADRTMSYWMAALTVAVAIQKRKKMAETSMKIDLTAETKEVVDDNFRWGLDSLDQKEIDAGFQEGYQYTPFVGFLGETSQYERTEALMELMGRSDTNKGRGWDAPRGGFSRMVNGRMEFLPPPDPKLTLPKAFQAHTEALIWNLKGEVNSQVFEMYNLYKLLHDYKKGELVEEELIDYVKTENGFTQGWFDATKDPRTVVQMLDVIYNELDDIFEYEQAKEHEYFKEEYVSLKTPDGKKAVNPLPLLVKKKVLRENKRKDLPDVLIHMANGSPNIIKFNTKSGRKGQDFVDSLKNAKYERLTGPMKVMNSVTRFMARMFTSYNPDFMFANAIRDMQTAYFNLGDSKATKAFTTKVLNPVTIAKMSRRIMKAELDIAAIEKKKTQGGKLAALKMDELRGAEREKALSDTDLMIELAAFSGARTGFFKHMSISDMAEELEKITDSKEPGYLKKKISALGNYLDAANSGIENAVRMVTFIEALRLTDKKGKPKFTVLEATMLARNVTVDFNKKGNYGTALGAWFVFFNAGVQGNIRVLTALANSGGKDGAKLLAGLIGTSVIHGYLARFLAPEDEEEGRSAYDDVGRWERDSNIVTILPNGSRVKIPLPWGYSLFWAVGQRIADMMHGVSGPIDSASSLVGNMNNQLNPMGQGHGFFNSLFPSMFMPLVDISRNRTFYGAPIQKEDFRFGAKTPAAFKSMPKTGWVYDDLSKAINSILGGDDVTPGSLRTFMHKAGLTDKSKLESFSEDDLEWGISGSMLEHFAEGYLAGPLKFLESASKGGWSLLTGNIGAPDAKDLPILRRFYVSETSDWITSDRFNKLRDRTLAANEYVKNLKKNVHPETARKGMQLNKKLLVAKSFVDAADRARKALQRKEYAVKRSKVSSEVKRLKLEQLRLQKIKATRRALAKARKLGLDV